MVSIISNFSSLFAQNNLEQANKAAQKSVARISSGSRIIDPSDDVGALAIGTVLNANLTSMKTLLTNTSQANSLLSTADGSLSNIELLLTRQKALATQANSGSLTATERSFLNEEFQALVTEIDRLVGDTTFNDIKLIDGSSNDKAAVTTATTTGSAAAGNVNFTGATIAAGKVVTIGGVTFTSVAFGAGTTDVQFNIGSGGDIEDTIDNLVAKLNAYSDTNISQATYSRSGTILNMTHDSVGMQGNAVTVVTDFANATATANFTDGAEGSLTTGRTDYSGALGDNLLVDLQGTYATGSTTFSTTTADLVADGETFIWDSGSVNTAAGLTFTFRSAANYATNQTSTDVLVGDTLEETIDNLVGKLNSYTGNGTDGAEDVNIFSFKRKDNVLYYTAKHYGTGIGGQTFTAVTTAGTIANDTASAVTTGVARNDTANDIGGIDVANVTNNKDFVGTISGFSVTYSSANTVNATVKVGDITYTANSITTNPVATQLVRFSSGSEGGGYFDIVMQANQGTAVADQTDAEIFEDRLDAAFSDLTFYQRRDISSYTGTGDIITNGSKTGTLTGSSMEIRMSDFSDVQVQSVKVTAPVSNGTDAVIEMVVNGETFRSEGGLGKSIGTMDLISTTDAGHIITFFAGDGGSAGGHISVATDAEALSLQTALESALGIGEGSQGLDFQVGLEATDSITVAMANAATTAIYKDDSGVVQTLDVLTTGAATTAIDVLTNAINSIASQRATIGALQSRFDYATANIETAIQNTEAARSDFLDTDIAEESTKYAQELVRIEASVALLAQANNVSENLLKLLN